MKVPCPGQQYAFRNIESGIQNVHHFPLPYTASRRKKWGVFEPAMFIRAFPMVFMKASCDYGIDVVRYDSMEWKIGCSGYHYPEWKRIFYPEDMPVKKWFEHYCTFFNTLELNVTYYKFPRVEVLKKWYARSPEDFSFTVKAPRYITHFKKFREEQKMLRDFLGTVKEGLGEKLGCILFQFPSNFHYQPDRLSRILEALNGSVRNVLEFRHASWWDPAVFEGLGKSNICFCGMSHPKLPDKVIATTDTIYYRMHGVPHLYTSGYELQTLEKVAHEILGQPNARRAYIYFNNTADGHAVTNARQLQDICELVH